jgi:hypothetical protein
MGALSHHPSAMEKVEAMVQAVGGGGQELFAKYLN